MLLASLMGSASAGVVEPCGVGRFVVGSAGLGTITSDQPPVFTVGDDGAITLSGCGSTLASVRVRRTFVRLRARWDDCGGLGRTRLTAVMSIPECRAFDARLRARRTRLQFSASKSTCGDGIVDSGVEACDASAPAGDASCPGACSAACTCSISTTTTPTTTCPTYTSTTIPFCGAGLCSESAWCSNAKQCVGTPFDCACVGRDLACGEPGDRVCGGACADGTTCQRQIVERSPGCFYAAGCSCMPFNPD